MDGVYHSSAILENCTLRREFSHAPRDLLGLLRKCCGSSAPYIRSEVWGGTRRFRDLYYTNGLSWQSKALTIHESSVHAYG